MIILVDMAYFRDLKRVVPSSLFSKPNSLYLTSRFRPVYLVSPRQEPSIDYLHSVRALLNTLDALSKASSGSYAKLVDCEQSYLRAQTNRYADAISKYVGQNGPLTGEAIGNIYFAAQRLGLSAEWLQKYVHHDIPFKYRLMSRRNLEDVATGLQKYHKNSPYLERVQQELASRPQQPAEYVEHLPNESTKYEFASNNPSNNVLLAAINSQSGVWRYYLNTFWSRIAHSGRYPLHSQ